jgi:hypothetical protein
MSMYLIHVSVKREFQTKGNANILGQKGQAQTVREPSGLEQKR